jgi:hypothetical protein
MALLAQVRPRDEIGQHRRRLAADQLADLVALDKKLAAVEAEIRVMVKRTPTGLPRIYGIGPVITATVIGEVGDVARFGDRHQFASYNGTAPDDKDSAGRPVHCVNLKGNRRLNHAIHMAAITQIRNRRSPGRACPASGIWLRFGVRKVGGGGQVEVSGEAPVERFVGSAGVEDLSLGLDVAGEVDAVGDVVAVELLVLQRAEAALAHAVGAR